MLTRLIILVLLCLFPSVIFAQVRSIPAVKITTPIKIDGNLEDEGWKSIESTGDFITISPVFGKISTRNTKVKIAYDNTAIYVGAYMYDHPSNIRKQLTARDVLDRQDVDIFTVGFDTYHDKQNGFVFKVSSANVQADLKISQSGTSNGGVVYDNSWDAVWESKTSIQEDGWVAEIKIPLSAIRFSKKDLQDWGINFARFTRKENENSVWNAINPNVSGELNQWGVWTGLNNISPPTRLSFLPYLSGGFRTSPTAKGSVTEFLRSGGMDVKYGINESFTLDMTLIPDFAQVQSYNVLLNLSPFEVKFDDYRPFFTEGTELFNKAGLFYSRRIGAAPGLSSTVLNNYGDKPGYKIDKNPGITRLYNATKFSGRTKGNLGIGVFNAVSAAMHAKITDLMTNTDTSILTEPLTNYNIIVLDQALKNRSSVSFTNTNVLRKGNTRNANVSSVDLSLFDKKNNHNFSLSGRYSNIWGKQVNKSGFTTSAGFGKVSGIIQYRASLNIESDKYDPNDLGFILNNNSFDYSGNIGYIMNKPTRHFLIHSYKLSFTNTYLYKPFVWSSFQMNASAFFLFKNFWDATISFQSSPTWNKDYFVHSNVYTGYFLRRTPYYYLGINGSSDSRKKLFVSWKLGAAESPLPNDPYWNGNLGLRYRFNDKFQLSTNMDIVQDKGNWGAVKKSDGSLVLNPDGSPVISRRNLKTNTAIVSGQYNFTSRMNVNFRLRHYWSYLDNTNFYNLKTDGYWRDTTFLNNLNLNFNTFNVDMFFTWDFLLGSRLTIAWKNALGGNAIINPYSNTSYFKNFGKAVDNPHSNEITVKVVYFLDYLKMRRRK
ncbi:MAG: carbohydrate binding family 9 domain-containing protein [Chitinophagaceae bacterium]|nr:carbohydrate binding family 9 domain-containing protein [Chitinophagaceae bacterium]